MSTTKDSVDSQNGLIVKGEQAVTLLPGGVVTVWFNGYTASIRTDGNGKIIIESKVLDYDVEEESDNIVLIPYVLTS